VSRHFSTPSQPWFRIGRFDIGTTEAVVVAATAMMVVIALAPALWGLLALIPAAVLRGLVWQVVTWPLANAPSFGAVWSLAVFWWAGRELERDLGRRHMGLFVGGLTLMQSVLAIGAGYLLRSASAPALAGLSGLGMLLVLVYIAEHPSRPFFFNIPAWIVGAVIVGIQILSGIFTRSWVELLVLLTSLLGAAVLARSLGLLTAYDAVPWIRLSGGRPSPRGGTGNVRYGPWEGSSVPQHETDELDSLLDKIAANGLGSLTERERRRLDDLRKRRRGR
jgi:hypothetical protein